MSMINSVLREGFDWRAIDIVFTRNIPSNDTDIANMVNTLKDIVSEETLLAQIPFVEDVQNELEKLKKEREENKELNPFFSVDLGYKTEAMGNSNKKEEEEIKGKLREEYSFKNYYLEGFNINIKKFIESSIVIKEKDYYLFEI